MNRPRRVPRREAERERPKPPPPAIPWPMLYATSVEHLGAYTAYVDRMQAMDQQPWNAGQWYDAMLAGFVT